MLMGIDLSIAYSAFIEFTMFFSFNLLHDKLH